MKGLAQPSAPNRAALIISFTHLAWKIAASYRHWSLELDDLHQIAMGAVTEAVDSFDPGRGIPLGKYVAKRIGYAIFRELERATRLDRPAGGYALMAADPSTTGQLDDDDLAQLRKALDSLPPRERHILTRLYGLDGRAPLTQSATGREIGLCRYTILKSAKRSLSTLRATLTD
jgi:RNA polymerase sigma factor (sigma-70 family)